jgi:prevent-host-death family protein
MKSASISETRQQLSALLNRVKKSREDVVIQNRGQAEAVIIPYADYALLQEAREKRRRQQAIAELHQIARDIEAQNEPLTDEEAAALADEVVQEAVANLKAQGKVTFQE